MIDGLVRCKRCGRWHYPRQHNDCSCPRDIVEREPDVLELMRKPVGYRLIMGWNDDESR